MRQRQKSVPFEKKETGFHKHAVIELAEWVNGITEKEFYIDGKIAFIPDVTCYVDGVLNCFYEVVKSHPLSGRKLAIITDWCYRNSTEVSIFEVSADFVLAQTKKPDYIQYIEYYFINPHLYNVGT